MRGAALVCACLAAACGATGAHAADSLYVVEQVVVSLNSNPDGSGERVASLKSGERVELLERAGESVHVRLPDGKEGWLRAIYVSGDAPMRPRLQESEAQVARLKADVSRLEAQLAAGATMSRAEPAPPAEDPAAAPAAMFSVPPPPQPRRLWAWVSLSALAALAVGFGLGWRTLDRSIRRKYGGLKIY